MTVRPIVTVGHPVLRERAREVSADELSSPERITAFVARVGS